MARATVEGREIVHEAVGGAAKVVEPGDIITRTSMAEVTIRPGRESRFVVEVERRGKFMGRVPVEVRGLPHGVRVLNIGLNGILITERETSREVVLYAEPWVKPMEHPIVVLAKSEGKNTDHAARSVLLKNQITSNSPHFSRGGHRHTPRWLSWSVFEISLVSGASHVHDEQGCQPSNLFRVHRPSAFSPGISSVPLWVGDHHSRKINPDLLFRQFWA